MSGLRYEDAVSQNSNVMSGELVFAGTRVPVWMLFDHLRHNHPVSEFFASYPSVKPEQVEAVLAHTMDETRRATA